MEELKSRIPDSLKCYTENENRTTEVKTLQRNSSSKRYPPSDRTTVRGSRI